MMVTFKRFLLFTLMLMIALTSFSVASSESQTELQEEALESYVEEAKESGKTFTVPVRVGPIYSVIIRKDGVGIVFNMVGSKAMEMGLQAVSFLMDLDEMDVALENGSRYSIPAVIQVQSLDVGTFITFNLTMEAANSLIEMLGANSPVVTVGFIHSDGARTDMTVAEVNDALSDVTGTTVDIFNQAADAVSTFGLNAASGISKFAGDAYTVVEGAIVDAGDFLSDIANDVGSSLGDAAESVGDALNDAAEGLGNLWNGLWGR